MAERLVLTIENENKLSWIELKEIIGIIDDYLLEKINRKLIKYYDYQPFWPYPPIWYVENSDDFSFIEIEKIKEGSIILVLTTAVAVFTLTAIAKGVRRSPLSKELTRFGENVGNIMSDGLSEINARLEDWSKTNKALRDRNSKVFIEKDDDQAA